MAIFGTILAGVFVFVLGQIVLKWLIETIQKLREEISNVVFFLASDISIIHNSNVVAKEDALECSKNLKMLGAKLAACQQLIPFYENTSKICKLPKKDDLLSAARKLSLMSNSMWGNGDDIFNILTLYRKEICEYLSVSDPIQDGMSKNELIKELRDSQKKV